MVAKYVGANFVMCVNPIWITDDFGCHYVLFVVLERVAIQFGTVRK